MKTLLVTLALGLGAPAAADIIRDGGGAPRITGTGKLRTAEVIEDGDSHAGVSKVSVRVQTAEGSQSFVVPALDSLNHFVTVMAMDWKDVVGDREPELWLEIEEHRDPCACEDGPLFTTNVVVICRAVRGGAQCSGPIERAASDNMEHTSFSGEVLVRGGLARVKLVESEGLSRLARRRATRWRRLWNR